MPEVRASYRGLHSPEDEEELEQAIAEAHEDLRAGRCITFDEMCAKLRVA